MSAKWKHLTWKQIAMMVLIVISGWILIGGIDCAPPDDSDLIIPLRDKPFEGDGNGWAMLSNVLEQETAYESCDGDGCISLYDREALWWYADPDCIIFDDDVHDPNVLAFFTNAVTGRTYVETLLKSNELLLAGIDAAIAAPTYDPPLVPPKSLGGDIPAIQLFPLLDVHRCELAARVKCAVEKGDFDAAIEYFGRNLRLATLLQTRCNGFIEYLVGTSLYRGDVNLLGRLLDDFAIPVETLRQFDELLKDLPGFSPEASAHALKLVYSYDKAVCMKRRVDIVFPEVDIVFSDKSGFTKQLLYPLARYAFHPNRYLCAEAKSIREALRGETIENWKCERREGRWLDALIPNVFGRIFGDNNYGRCLKQAKESALIDIAAVRRKISERIDAQQTNGEFVASSHYFPLVFTNGCYYTHDLKKIVGRAQ